MNELATILASDIRNSIEGFRRNFNETSKQNTLNIHDEMRTKGSYREFVTASTQDNLTGSLFYAISILPA